MTGGELIERQSLPLSFKLRYMDIKIIEFYEANNGQVYVAYSGGKDSELLVDRVRRLYPDVPIVFCDTGLEFTEIRRHVMTHTNVVWLKPSLRFDQVIERHGYPVVSKEVAMAINRYRNTKSQVQRDYRLNGGVDFMTGKRQSAGVIPAKWKYLLDAPFKISEQCCYFMKKAPFAKYERETGRKPFIGTMACDSQVRRKDYLKFGCNAFDKKKIQSRPMSILLEQDVWHYLKENNVPYCSIYNMGYDRTGCMFCAFGCHMEKESRFDRMAITHPAEYKYCMNQLGMKEVLQWVTDPFDPTGYLKVTVPTGWYVP